MKIPTDTANKAIQGNWQCKRRHLVAKLVTNASSATWWPKLEPIQVVPPGGARSTNCWPNLQEMQVAPSGGQMQNQCKKRHLVAKIGTNTSYKLHHLLAKLGTNTSDATFKLIYVIKMIQLIEAMPWVRCASGNV